MSEYTVADFADLRRDLALARKELADLREENRRLEQVLQSPLLMEALEVAWEAAEAPTGDAPIRAGDVMIYPVPDGHAVRKALVDDGLWRSDTRILSRAPREPWQDLADDLAERSALMDEDAIETAAKALHKAGWRKGGEDDE